MSRLLGVIPWVISQKGAALADISKRFDYPENQLVEDLTGVVFFVGVDPFTPDQLIEVDIADGEVMITNADWFSKPLRLTPNEGARLLTAGHSFLDTHISNSDSEGEAGPLLRALTKLGMALANSKDADASHDVVEVRLGSASKDMLSILKQAQAQREKVEISYYSIGRDKLTKRIIEPQAVFSDFGAWYVQGWCEKAVAERTFRVDRIQSIMSTGEAQQNWPQGPRDMAAFTPSETASKVVLSLEPHLSWVGSHYPTTSTKTDDEGRIIVSFLVSEVRWLERLLLRLGKAAQIVSIDPPLGPNVASTAAKRVLKRYQGASQ